VCFVPKHSPSDPTPWKTFGADITEYERWIAEICGVCCLKMIGDTAGITRGFSLYQLTMMCVARGGFVLHDDGRIEGVFHYPLAELSNELGIHCYVERSLTVEKLINAVAHRCLAILSIDLAKVSSSLSGGHLILVHDYRPETKTFIVHDCSSVLAHDGCGVPIQQKELARISNDKGLIASVAHSIP
jgi:hypothetical protein